MATPTQMTERGQLLKRAEEYRTQGYEVSLEPRSEDLPDFLKDYRPDMVVRRGDEAAVIEVRSRSSLKADSSQYLRNLTQAIAQHPGWRLELVMANPEGATDSTHAAESLPALAIAAQLPGVKQLATQHREAAILQAWSLVEATLRLVAEKEALSVKKFDTAYLIKQLATEGSISRAEYQVLMDLLSLRNAIAHGFKTTALTENVVDELVAIAEQILAALHANEAVS